MASLQAMLRIHSEEHWNSPERLTGDINRHLCQATEASRFASFFYAVYDAGNRLLTYVNAGHNPPMVLRLNGGNNRSLGAEAYGKPGAEFSIIRLDATGMVLGVDPSTEYKSSSIKMEDGDILVIFTDGVTEAMDKGENEFGEDNLVSVLSGLIHLPAREIAQEVAAAITRHQGAAPQADDITIIVAKSLGGTATA
jgi:sigma-B regulation protein RsbU (phosphoserine phosphatase)